MENGLLFGGVDPRRVAKTPSRASQETFRNAFNFSGISAPSDCMGAGKVSSSFSWRTGSEQHLTEKRAPHVGKLCRSYDEEQKAPTYILPCSVVPSVRECRVSSNSIRREIKNALEKSGQTLWTTRPRISGLMALINHIASCRS